jgi:hypothetical protein
MKRHIRYDIGLAIVMLVSAATGIKGAAHGTGGKEFPMTIAKESAAALSVKMKLPGIDEVQPAKFETASFALG